MANQLPITYEEIHKLKGWEKMEALKEYHRKSYVQINIPESMILSLQEKEDLVLRDLIYSSGSVVDESIKEEGSNT